MTKVGLLHFTDIYLTLIALIIFFGFFVGVIFWVHRKNSGDCYHYLENLPLEEGVLCGK